jgi:hypothetical protein
MKIALRKPATLLHRSKRVASAERAEWLRQERSSALFDDERVWSDLPRWPPRAPRPTSFDRSRGAVTLPEDNDAS